MRKSVYLLFIIFAFGCSDALQEDINIRSPKGTPCLIGPNGIECEEDGDDPEDPFDPPAIPRFQYFHRGNSNANIYWAQSTNGAITWNSNGSVTNSATTNSGPAGVFHNNQFHVFYRGNSSDKIFRSNSSNGTSWSGNQWVRSDMRSTDGVTALSYGGKIWLGYNSPDHAGATYTTSTDGFTWSPSVELPATTTGVVTDAPSFVEFEGNLYVIYSDHLGKIWQHKYNNLTSTWATRVEIHNVAANKHYPIPGQVGYLDRDGISAISFDGYIYLAYRRHDNDFIETWGYDPDATFNQYTTPIYADGKKTSERPTITTDGTTLLIVFKNNTNSQIWQTKSTNAANWSSTQILGQTNSVPSVFHFVD